MFSPIVLYINYNRRIILINSKKIKKHYENQKIYVIILLVSSDYLFIRGIINNYINDLKEK